MHILSVVGTRPNFIKVAPIHDVARAHSDVKTTLVHTGQHYDRQLSDVFIEELNIRDPDAYLEIGGGTQTEQTAAIMTAFASALENIAPDVVLVVGDVTSTLASALVANRKGLPALHVEAGLRSGNRDMPEEINRKLTDHICDTLFTTEPSAVHNLGAEGIPLSRIHYVGNVMIDSLVTYLTTARDRDTLERLAIDIPFVLVTLHRPSNVDDNSRLRSAVHMLKAISADVPLAFPAHPRTEERLHQLDLYSDLSQSPRVTMLEPLGYLDFLHLMDKASAVITDSGGIQEETTILNTPCLTVRPSTERPATLEYGTNELVPLDTSLIRRKVSTITNNDNPPHTAARPPLWDGKAAERILSITKRKYGTS